MQKDDFLAVHNLDSGNWHVPLHPSQYPLFGVSIYDELEKKTNYYQWVVLFLGLSDAVHIFTKLLLLVVKHLVAGREFSISTTRIHWSGPILGVYIGIILQELF